MTRYLGPHFLSTLPIRDLIRAMDPPAPAEVIAAAESLKYRDFLTVVLIVDRPETFPDNWIYIHEPEVRVGRIQNFKNWSPDLVPDPRKTAWAWSTSASRATTSGPGPTPTCWHSAGARSTRSAWSPPPRSSTAASSACPRPIRSTTTSTRATSP